MGSDGFFRSKKKKTYPAAKLNSANSCPVGLNSANSCPADPLHGGLQTILDLLKKSLLQLTALVCVSEAANGCQNSTYLQHKRVIVLVTDVSTENFKNVLFLNTGFAAIEICVKLRPEKKKVSECNDIMIINRIDYSQRVCGYVRTILFYTTLTLFSSEPRTAFAFGAPTGRHTHPG